MSPVPDLPASPALTFASVTTTASGDRVWLLAEDADGAPLLLQLRGDTWRCFALPWHPVALHATTTPSLALYLFGAEAELLLADRDGWHDLGDTGSRSGARGIMRSGLRLGDTLYLAGMSGQIYRRQVGAPAWEDISPVTGTIDVSRAGASIPDRLLGIEALCATPGGVLAVGFDGIALLFDGDAWHRRIVPTASTLNAAAHIDGITYACDQDGMVYADRGDGFVPTLDAPAPAGGLWSVTGFAGQVFLAGPRRVYRLAGRTLEPVDTGLGPDATCGGLSESDTLLWSVGPQHLACSHDGIRWQRIGHASA